MSDLMRYGLPAAAGLVTNYMGARAQSRGDALALEESRREFDATQQWLREQEANTDRRHREVEDEKRRQFDALQAEKLERHNDRAPFRAAARGALTRMTDLMDRGPQRFAYQPTFRYEP